MNGQVSCLPIQNSLSLLEQIWFGRSNPIIEAGIAGTDSTEISLQGKHHNRGVRVAQYVYEAMQHLKLRAFQSWLEEERKMDILVY